MARPPRITLRRPDPALAAAGIYLWQTLQVRDAFATLAAQGQAALERVETTPNFGRDHLQPGQTHQYDRPFPTSGTHAPVWVDPGLYDEPQPMTELIHSMEHGHIVIFYDDPGAEAMSLIRYWSALFGGQWDGIVATPRSGLGKEVVLTAWRKTLRQDRFEPAAAAAFINAFRGRGPEHPVR